MTETTTIPPDLVLRARELDKRRVAALLAADATALADLLHPALVYTHSTGRQDDFDSYVKGIATGSTSYRSVHRSEEHAFAMASSCVLEGIVDLQVRIGGVEKSMRNRYMALWTFNGADGRLVRWASTRITEAP